MGMRRILKVRNDQGEWVTRENDGILGKEEFEHFCNWCKFDFPINKLSRLSIEIWTPGSGPERLQWDLCDEDLDKPIRFVTMLRKEREERERQQLTVRAAEGAAEAIHNGEKE